MRVSKKWAIIYILELRTRIDLSKPPLTIWNSSNWRHVIGAVCPNKVLCDWPVRTRIDQLKLTN